MTGAGYYTHAGHGAPEGRCLPFPTLLRRGGAARGTTFAIVFGGFGFPCGGVLAEIVDWKHIAD